jgi:hypothetical protein
MVQGWPCRGNEAEEAVTTSLGRNADLPGTEPNPLMRWCPLSNRHKRIISLVGRNYEIQFGSNMFPKGWVRWLWCRGGDGD